MKKALVLLLALCAVSAFAQDAAYDIEAEASVTWGYNLNDDSTGFVNDMSFELTFPLIAGESAATEGEGVYGELTITGLNLALYNDGDEAKVFDNYDEDGFYDTIEAKIVAGPMYVTIWEGPDFELNNAQMQGPLSIDDYEDGDWFAIIADSAGVSGGITFGYANDMLDVALQLASNGAYEDGATDAEYGWVDADDNPVTPDVWGIITPAGGSAPNVDGEYTVGLTLSVTPVEMLTVDFAAFADMYDGANKGLTAQLTVTPIEGLELVAAFDGSIVGTADLVWDAAFAATYTLANADEFGFTTYYVPNDSFPGADAYLEFGVSATEDGEEGFVPALGASAYFKIYNVLGEDPTVEGLPAFVGATVDYTVTLEEGKTVMPYAGFDLGLLHSVGVTTDNGLAFKVGVDVNMIANTTITVEFAGGSVEDDEDIIGSIVPFGDTTDKGLFTVACTIALSAALTRFQ